MKLGDALEKIFKYTGIKWLVNKIVVDWLGYKSCGCEKRKEKLNHIKINLWKKRRLNGLKILKTDTMAADLIVPIMMFYVSYTLIILITLFINLVVAMVEKQ